jgi:hypothetical protein
MTTREQFEAMPSREQVETLAAMRRGGAKFAELCEVSGLAHSIVRRVLRAQDKKLVGQYLRRRYDHKEAFAMARAGYTSRMIGSVFGVSHNAVLKTIRRMESRNVRTA